MLCRGTARGRRVGAWCVRESPGVGEAEASHQHLSPSSSGYSPTWTSPFKCAASTAEVSGRWSSCRLPLCHPPRTAGIQPPLPVRGCHTESRTRRYGRRTAPRRTPPSPLAATRHPPAPAVPRNRRPAPGRAGSQPRQQAIQTWPPPRHHRPVPAGSRSVVSRTRHNAGFASSQAGQLRAPNY